MNEPGGSGDKNRRQVIAGLGATFGLATSGRAWCSSDDLALAEERVPRREGKDIAIVAELLKESIRSKYAGNVALRAAHPKQTAGARARFKVLDTIPAELRVGIFAPGAEYQALVRFSNAALRVKPDVKPDVRGFAVKLVGVTDTPIEQLDPDPAQDFVTISGPTLVVRDVAEFVDFTRRGVRDHLPAFFLPPWHWDNLAAVTRLPKQSGATPLDLTYWSTTPYLLGEGRAVKYRFSPVRPFTTGIPGGGDTPFHERVWVRLGSSEAVFEMAVQLQTNARHMPIEDALVRWDERVSPFQPVATLTIPRQALDEELEATVAQASFNPWHAQAAHRPLGGLNRARRVVYRELVAFRRAWSR